MSYITTKNQYITVSNNKIVYRELSKGKSDLPLVMLVHLAAILDNWDPKLLDLLAEKHHVIVLDLPGVGASQGKVAPTIPGMAEQAVAIIKALGHEKINLLGLSMGGFIAQEIVRLDSQLVNRLILAGTGPRGGFEVDKVTGKTFRYMLKAGLERVDPKRYIFYNHDEAGRLEAEKVLGRMGQRSAAHADKDMQVPTENSYTMHEKIKNSQLIIYPNAGHGSIFQNAEDFSKALLAFLEETNA
ncbi:TPA: alpha/beta hydrolase [Streptococcus suis]|uniref:alpha/beta fold hydrolase n=1 Tax=Streptococcus suis TaxID=1307 RepID=UPI0015519100|nr:alpha/beta fold hydrolase [Streptococcus suis]MDY7594987.1 alpha/beta hydrolase [Streptococcus suis]NQQ28699.1 alpha/beta hydrolase [Streptococcus suis]HEL2253944.1 alpha/beta hydrolase [Streptococcus suis]HEL2264671.1 alpha/beta hydrolase [Streptococcus suis]HEL2298447.1 alpha/beta hydrolase [Streptococcus suis]